MSFRKRNSDLHCNPCLLTVTLVLRKVVIPKSGGRNYDVKIPAFFTEYSLNLAIWTALGSRDKEFDQDSGADYDLRIRQLGALWEK